MDDTSQENIPVNSLQEQERTKGKWRAGISGNPTGRRSGTRNKATLLAQQLIQSDIETISLKLVDMAKDGNIEAIKLIFTRLVPPARERIIKFEAPKINSFTDLIHTVGHIVEALAKGEITPTEASNVTSVLERLKRITEHDEFQERLNEVERYVKQKITE